MSGLTKASTHVLDWVYQCEHSPATGLGLAVSSSCNQTRSACRPGFFAHMPDNVLEDWQGVDQAWQRALESWLLCIEDRAHGKRSRETTSLAASKRVFSVGAVGVRLALFFLSLPYLFLCVLSVWLGQMRETESLLLFFPQWPRGACASECCHDAPKGTQRVSSVRFWCVSFVMVLGVVAGVRGCIPWDTLFLRCSVGTEDYCCSSSSSCLIVEAMEESMSLSIYLSMSIYLFYLSQLGVT